MYGLVNRAIEQLVVSLKGEPAWRRVCQRANVQADGFVAMCPYHDDVTYRLVGAVSEEMSMPAESVLEAFGEYWILYTAEEGYGELLESGGSSLREFLDNLNDMHGRVETVFPQMRLPQFDVQDIEPGRYRVAYSSEREGLAPMVTGLLKGLAQRFGEKVDVRLVHARGKGCPVDLFEVQHVEETVAA